MIYSIFVDVSTPFCPQDFYWKGYHIVREQAPHWLYLMHDSFNFDVNVWGTFMKNCPTIGLDTHVYQVQWLLCYFSSGRGWLIACGPSPLRS